MGFSLGGLGKLVSGVSGADQKAQAVDGFGTLPKQVQDEYLKTYLPGVQRVYNNPAQTLPMVRYDEQNPLFRSQAMTNLQAMSDQTGGLFRNQYGTQGMGSQGQGAGDSAMMDEILGQLYAMQLSGGAVPKGNTQWQNFTNKAKPADYAALGKKLKGSKKGNGRLAGGFVDDSGNLIDISSILYGLR